MVIAKTRRQFIRSAARLALTVGGVAAGLVSLGTRAAATCPCTAPYGRCSGCSGNTCPSTCTDTGYWWTCFVGNCTLYCHDCRCPISEGETGLCYCDKTVCGPQGPQQ